MLRRATWTKLLAREVDKDKGVTEKELFVQEDLRNVELPLVGLQAVSRLAW